MEVCNARSFLTSLYKSGHQPPIQSLPGRTIRCLLSAHYGTCTKGIYREDLLTSYTKEQIEELGECIDPSRDLLFDYIGLLTLAERYLANDFDGRVMELPQERYMVIAMFLMHNEPADKRLDLVKEAYWAMSNLYMTAATPTMSNTGKR